MHRRSIEAFHPDCVESVQAGEGSVMFWGCFLYHKMGSFIAVTMNLNQHAFSRIPNDEVLPFAIHLQEKHHLTMPVLQDYNYRVHRAKTMSECRDEQSATLSHLDWPAKSPDLNSVENLWDHLEQTAKPRNKHPRTLVELRNQLTHEWPQIDVQYIHNLVESTSPDSWCYQGKRLRHPLLDKY